MEKFEIASWLSLRAQWQTRSRFLEVSLAAAALVTLVTFQPASAAPKPCPLTHSAQATFSGAIHDDGNGPYIDGVDGVQCVFFDPACGGSGDLVFDTEGTNGRKPRTVRSLCFDFSGAATEATSCTVMPDTLPPAYCGHGHLVLGVRDWGTRIYSMAPGSQQAGAIWFTAGGEISLRYRGPYASDNLCSTPVSVQRSLDGSTWTISTIPTTGDLAAVFQYLKGGWVLTDFRHVQFQLTVTLLP
jgi:hypothetical protein